MALVILAISDTRDGQVAVSMIAEPAMVLESTEATTPAQAAALRIIELITTTPEQSVVTLND